MDPLFSPPVLLALLMTIGAAAATLLGGLSVIWARESNPRLLAFGLAFAGGAMVYVSLVEIFVKSQLAFTQGFDPKTGYALATLSFFAGVGLISLLDYALPNPHVKLEKKTSTARNKNSGFLKRVTLFSTLAITAHNFPEGMATFFSTLDNPTVGTTLGLAIAIHNIPEGISVALPVFYATGSKRIAMMATCISAAVEPVGAIIGYLVLAPFLSPPVYGAVFGIIAGAMVYLSLDELLPAARRYAKGHETVYGIVSGMAVLALSLVLFK